MLVCQSSARSSIFPSSRSAASRRNSICLCHNGCASLSRSGSVSSHRSTKGTAQLVSPDASFQRSSAPQNTAIASGAKLRLQLGTASPP